MPSGPFSVWEEDEDLAQRPQGVAQGFDNFGENTGALGVGGSDGITLAGGCWCLEHGVSFRGGMCVSSDLNMGLPERLHKRDFPSLQLRYIELKCLTASLH
jgi:hypothetical protein